MASHGLTSSDFSAEQNPNAVPPILGLWAMRLIMLEHGLEKTPCRRLDIDDIRPIPILCELLDDHESDDPADEYNQYDEESRLNKAKTWSRIKQLHRKAQSTLADATLPPVLAGNIAQVGQLLGLSPTEQQVLGFCILLHSDKALNGVASSLNERACSKLEATLSAVLGIPRSEIHTALHSRGKLKLCGLLQQDGYYGPTSSLSNRLELSIGDLCPQLCESPVEPAEWLKNVLCPVDPPTLTLDDFTHIPHIAQVLLPYLRQAQAQQRKGVNIFIYGAPGTGKSQLARVLAQELHCPLMEVSFQRDNGRLMDAEDRLKALVMGQHFFASTPALLLMDEAEDVFNDASRFSPTKSTAGQHKAWMHHQLENNAVPTLWLSNTAEGLDPATIRRFDLVLEMTEPGFTQRLQILQKQCAALSFTPNLHKLASQSALTPAVVERAAAVVQAIASDLPEGSHAKAMEQLIDNTLTAQGNPTLAVGSAHNLPAHYDPTFINTNADLATLARGVQQQRSARICLWGPAGTGKTAFARWLAQQLDAPLHVKRASELLSPWLGMSEKNIADAFRKAESEKAVLLIDEVDSFLQDRRGARNSWEVTQVNEMLTQMEGYSGIFIASTNLMHGLDQAVLRRFDLKLCFDHLRAEQAVQLLRRQCQTLNLPEPSEQEAAALGRLRNLTPGDFAAVARRHAFAPLGTTAELLQALQAECALKESASNPIGFH